MGKVRLLPEVMAHQIAAGEIVERPASVLKELLENSLDAQATSISVRAEAGGQRLICVRDNGMGMSPEDARLAFERHATSKIRTLEDLTRIQTLGFRGEALPSIASVSRLRLRTCAASRSGSVEPGTEVQIQGGQLVGVREISRASGTEVLVEDLFYNVPARKKFLKSYSTDLGHLTRQLTHFCLAYPSVRFQFSHHDRLLLEADVSGGLEDRVFQVLGESFLENLVPVDYRKNRLRVNGFVSLPHDHRSNTASQFLFVNRRMVRDRVMAHAVGEAYRDAMPARSHARVLLFLEIEPEAVDVNVHPAKTEVRFRHSGTVHSAVLHAVEEALDRHRVDLSSLAKDLPPSISRNQPRPPARTPFQPARPGSGLFSPPSLGDGSDLSRDSVVPTPEPVVRESSTDPHLDNIPETSHLNSNPVVMGQFVESFIVAADRESVLLIDQHVAHERILFDRALKAMDRAGKTPTQYLLEPLKLELTPEQTATVAEILDDLNHSGFAVEWFGDRTILVRGVPALARSCDPQELFQEIMSSLQSEETHMDPKGSSLRRRREKIAISLACRSAIKINTPLSREKIQWLLDQLMLCDTAYTCPHGRPIVLRIGIEEILRGFKRI